MKKRGFDTQEILEKLHEKGIEIKPPTLTKYLNEFKRGKEQKKDTPLSRITDSTSHAQNHRAKIITSRGNDYSPRHRLG